MRWGLILVGVLLWCPVAGAEEHTAEWYQTHWNLVWGGDFMIGGRQDANLGNTSSSASGAVASDGALEAHLYYGKSFIGPTGTDSTRMTSRVGTFHLGALVDGKACFDLPHASYVEPGLLGSWDGPRTIGLEPFAAAAVRYDHFSNDDIRDSWTVNGKLGARHYFPVSDTRGGDWHGYADAPELWLDVNAGYEQRTSTASDAVQRKVFSGSDAWANLQLFLHLVAHDRMSPARLIRGISLLGIYEQGDLVSTGPATPDVMGAASAATPDPYLDTSAGPPTGFSSYRLSATTTTLQLRLDLGYHFALGAQRAMMSGGSGFQAVADSYWLNASWHF